MKIKNKLVAVGALCFSMFTTGCGDKFLTHDNLFEVNTDTYYQNSEEVFQGLTAAYSELLNVHHSHPLLIANILSDDCFGGGGNLDKNLHSIDNFTQNIENQYLGLWSNSYEGIFKLNTLIGKIDREVFEDEATYKQYLGEAHFLRGLFYFRVAKFFGSGPLRLGFSTEAIPKASADEIFGQIAYDLKQAIEILPSTPYTSSMNGRGTKWAAEGIMARAFLFYTGVYGKTSITLPEEGEVTKEQVVSWLDDCIKNSGHNFSGDFRNNWPYSYTNEEYAYAKDNGLSWVEDASGNIEVLFSEKYNILAKTSGAEEKYSNMAVLYMGMRVQPDVPAPFGKTAWGAATVNKELWDSFEVNDIRKEGSIISVNNPIEGLQDSYRIEKDQMHETGYWNKKYTPIDVERTNAEGSVTRTHLAFHLYGAPASSQEGNIQDFIILRYPDLLLMAAELGLNAQENLDKVRQRVNLASVPATLENIKQERRHEFAFEGVRYFDLLRWGDAETAINKANGTIVINQLVEAAYEVKFRPETKGFLPIPESEIRNSGGVVEQNPGW